MNDYVKEKTILITHGDGFAYRFRNNREFCDVDPTSIIVDYLEWSEPKKDYIVKNENVIHLWGEGIDAFIDALKEFRKKDNYGAKD